MREKGLTMPFSDQRYFSTIKHLNNRYSQLADRIVFTMPWVLYPGFCAITNPLSNTFVARKNLCRNTKVCCVTRTGMLKGRPQPGSRNS